MYNPMLDYQRNQLLAQQAMIQNQLNQMQSQPHFNPYPQNQQPQFFVRQVGNVEEAKGFPVDPNTMYFFLDTGTGRIYMKKLNPANGKSDFFIYEVKDSEEKEPDAMGQINERLSNIEKLIGGMYDKSVSGNGNDAKPNGNVATADAGAVSKAESADVSAGPADGERKKR